MEIFVVFFNVSLLGTKFSIEEISILIVHILYLLAELKLKLSLTPISTPPNKEPQEITSN